ncbi:UTP--glucose-1-phosphate uridylyltransferase GalU [Sansalvadorimonas sp. 2012CJ34-2]|uniref:UTP--glucose-1-phosphate uridylyltransferase n=1 Tax=Parendozoicomonas callyspongiae TaxID=2942213 RepID=A0ABT0PEQ8_9GAMM|nr:UTP--glucose-1-phosphate uridylyltransferase GalU [Sansalvadorimonas sp. 2012CJ34-2]MCL6269701.1 UTP--glucose-1-phosphate uridylyltransferase GalU [Sansalvadorimonas sp. 2012CJ34-2]
MITKCLYPVAGYGTRFLPATKSMPKEMMPVVDKPLIQYAVEEAMNAGVTDMGFVTGRTKRAIEDHFDINYELEKEIAGSGKEQRLSSIREVMAACTFSYTRQKQMQGLGHAILTGKSLVGDNPFGVILADDLCINPEGQGVLAQMATLFNQFRCSIVAVQEVPEDEIHKYGVIAGEAISDDIIRVTDMVEKPAKEDAPSNLAVIGRYILTPDIFDIIESTPPGKNGEVQITDAILTQAKQGCVLAYRFKGNRFDCGSVPGFIEATNYVYENYFCC